MIYKQLWAKSDPHHYLWRHLLDVAAVVEALWPRFGPLENMPLRWACYVCALHDIGKADPWFQNKNDEMAKCLADAGLTLPPRLDTTSRDMLHFRHEARSRRWMLDVLPGRHGWSKKAARVVVHAINGHHGDFAADCYSENEWPDQRARWEPMREQLERLVWDVLQPPPYAPQTFAHAGAVGVALSGLIILADWIASNEDIYDYTRLRPYEDPHEYYEQAYRQAAAVVGKMKMDAAGEPATAAPPSFGDVWPERAQTPRPSQRTLEAEVLAGRIQPGLAIIEAQMGEGKTEGAVYLGEAWNGQRGMQGLYLGLPTQATSNQMYDRYEKFLKKRGRGGARLVHGMAWLDDDQATDGTAQTFGDAQERLLSREWFRPLRRALLAPDGVGTVDQALLAALHVKFGVLRLLGLRTKVLVVDEAHAYDDYMTTILEQLLKWCRALEIPVILLSATLSAKQKRKLVAAYGGQAEALAGGPEEAYPLLTFVSLDGAVRTVPIPRDPALARALTVHPHAGLLDDPEAIARLALQRIASGGCACVLMNTVKGAQQVYSAIKDLLGSGEFAPPDELGLFHARFRAERRKAIEDRVTALYGSDATVENGQRPRRAILVATQVVEQSLDVDFDFFLTQLAPIDLILQRCGRLWRHLRTRFADGPAVDILLPPADSLQFGVSERIYAREVLLRTLAVLHGCESIALPDQFRPLIEAVYGEAVPVSDIVPPEAIAAAAADWKKARDEARGKAHVHLLPDPKANEFLFAKADQPEAEEGEAQTYLRVSTRLGDRSRAALVLNDARSLTLAKRSLDGSKKPPHKAVHALFGHKVNLPVWWLNERDPAEGFEPIFDGQDWLRGHVVVPLRDGVWRAASGAVIRDDEELGLTFTAPQAQDEADAGVTN